MLPFVVKCECNKIHTLWVYFSSLSTHFRLMQHIYIRMLIYATLSCWMVAAPSVNLYIAILYDFYDNLLCLWNWNPDDRWTVRGKTMSGSRSYGRLLYEEGVWVVITAIVWIARPCVAYWADSTQLCYEVYQCATWLILET